MLSTFIYSFGFYSGIFIKVQARTPSIIVSFGGYIACRWWWQGGYLVFRLCLHEHAPGRANKIVALFVRSNVRQFLEMEQEFSSKSHLHRFTFKTRNCCPKKQYGTF